MPRCREPLVYLAVQHLLTARQRKVLYPSWPPGCVFIPPAFHTPASLWALSCHQLLWVQSHSIVAGRHPQFTWAWNRQQFAWVPGIVHLLTAVMCVCYCFLVCHFDLLFFFKEQLLLNKWDAAIREWEDLLTVSNRFSLLFLSGTC